jgi:hypothetical protein
MNPHLDAVPLSHAGRAVVIRFTWRALKVLQREWGDGWRERFASALTTENVDDLAALVGITSGMSPEEVEEWSPPLTPTVKALWDAYAFLKTGEAAPQEGEADANPRRAQSILSKASAALRYALASAGPNSGKAPH